MGWFKWRPSCWPKSQRAAPASKKPYGNSWFPPRGLFKTSLEMQYAALADLHATVVDTTAADEKKLEAEFNKLKNLLAPGDDHLDSVIDEVLSLRTQTRWSALLHAVAVYHYLECEVVLLMRWRFSAMPEKEADMLIRQVHQWDRLKDLTKVYLGTQLSTLTSFTTVDELRCVANAAKHTAGLISKDLANRKGKTWKEGEPIDPTKLNLPAYRDAAVAFLSDLVQKAEAGVTKEFGAPPAS